MTNWRVIREQILERCQNYCEKCGAGLPNNFALHHRKLRSRGGKDTLDNLLALHHECHNLGTNSVHMNINEAELKGYIVPQHATPSEYPLTLPDKSTVTLSPEGNYIYLERQGYGW